jgi:hypothetical protein
MSTYNKSLAILTVAFVVLAIMVRVSLILFLSTVTVCVFASSLVFYNIIFPKRG